MIGEKGLVRNLAAGFAIALLAFLPVCGIGQARVEGEPLDARLEGAPFLPYRFNTATLTSESGIRGELRVSSIDWDGSKKELFEGYYPALSDRVGIAFYLDEEARSLVLELEDSGRIRSLVTQLVESEPFGTSEEVDSAKEGETLILMRGLSPPSLSGSRHLKSTRYALEGRDFLSAGQNAARDLFFIERNPLATIPLLVLAGLAIAAAVLRGKADLGRIITAAVFAAALLAIPAILVSVQGKPALWKVSFPSVSLSSSISGMLELRNRESVELLFHEWSLPREFGSSDPSPGSRSIALLGIDGDRRRDLPLEELDLPGTRIRLSVHPSVTWRDGSFRLGFDAFATGWMLHE